MNEDYYNLSQACNLIGKDNFTRTHQFPDRPRSLGVTRWDKNDFKLPGKSQCTDTPTPLEARECCLPTLPVKTKTNYPSIRDFMLRKRKENEVEREHYRQVYQRVKEPRPRNPPRRWTDTPNISNHASSFHRPVHMYEPTYKPRQDACFSDISKSPFYWRILASELYHSRPVMGENQSYSERDRVQEIGKTLICIDPKDANHVFRNACSCGPLDYELCRCKERKLAENWHLKTHIK